MLKTGMIIAERYEILGKIGTGGMADVYKAKDHKLNRFVAVKVLKAEFREDTTFIRKFKSEAQAAAGLTHPNIVNVFDVGDDEGVYYIVMELIEGITLKEYISKKGKLSIKEATSIAIQVSMGLEAAHSHGIVHRDVKPQNIIISTDGKVKVTDFGIARAASSNTISSNVMGSVHYSSPEQVRGGYSDEKSDIYSLGITLYEMVTGKVPFDGDTTVAIAIKHLQEEMVPPSVYTEELPYSLEQIIFKCTQKSVDRRYSKMEDVIADLKHSLIDPQGDFVKLASVDNAAKTVVISDRELGEIKHSPKNTKQEALDLVEEMSAQQYEDAEEERPRRKTGSSTHKSKNSKKRKKKRHGSGFTIAILLVGILLLAVLIYVFGRASGLIGGNDAENQSQTAQQQETQEADDGMVEVPNLVGKTEAEAKTITAELNIGLQPLGEEASDQEKGRISSQDLQAGTRVEKYTTLKYYVSAGARDVTVPDTDGMTGIAAQELLESSGFTVQVEKEYSDTDENGYAYVDPGYVYYTEPEAGTSAKSGSAVTLIVSRGVDYGDSAEIPSVVGMTRNEALTTLGKFLDVQVVEQQSSEVEAGRVISQSPEAYAYADPDMESILLTVSSGNQAPSTTTDNTSGTTGTTGTMDMMTGTNAGASTGNTTAGGTTTATADGTWKCTQSLDTPTGYQGGAIRLELLQEVNGELQASVISEGYALSFPYKLDVTGASGVSTGTMYIYEQVDGLYQLLGQYPLLFEKVE